MAKRFTVIVPVYNLAAYLNKCLASLQAQTYTGFDVWLIDDGSTDGSVAIMQAWVKKDSRFHLWRQPANQGVSAARNVGLRQAQGDYICFVDGDDWCEPTYLAGFAEQMAQPQVDMALCGYSTDDDHSTKAQTTKLEHNGLKVFLGDDRQRMLTQHQMLAAVLKPSGDIRGFLWNKCYRLDVIRQQHLVFDEEISLLEDQLFNVAYVLQTQRFYYVATPQYHYVMRENSAIHKWTPQTLPAELQALSRIQQLLSQHPELQFSRLLARRRKQIRHDLVARLHQPTRK